MTKRLSYITRHLRAFQALQHRLVLLLPLVLVSCADEFEQPEHDVDFCVRAVWQDGLSGGKTTRALSATDILADGTEDITIDYADYPDVIDVVCKKAEEEILDLTLTKGTAPCTEHSGFWSYTTSFLFRDQLIRREDYKFYATATIDEGDELEGTADKDDIHDTHLLLTLHHTKALLRFAFMVDPRYDKVRYIKVTGITLNDEEGVIVDKVLNKEGMTLIGYCYIDPTVVTTKYENTILCTYNIYDKDPSTGSEQAEWDAHLTRKDVVAQNKFTLGTLKNSSDSNVSEIQAGYYYDLKVTLNPDYLYVLSEHDNKQHLKVE